MFSDITSFMGIKWSLLLCCIKAVRWTLYFRKKLPITIFWGPFRPKNASRFLPNWDVLETVLHCEGFRIILDLITEAVRLQWHTMAFTFAFLRNTPQLSREISLLTFHRNRSMVPAPPTTPHPLFPVQQVKLNLVAVPSSELRRSFL